MKHKIKLITVLMSMIIIAAILICLFVWYINFPSAILMFPAIAKTPVNHYIEYRWNSGKTFDDNVQAILTFENDVCVISFTGYGDMMNFDTDSQESWHSLNNMTTGWITQIKKVKIDNGIQSVGDYTFTDNNIEQINIPSSVIYIGEHAFDNCMSLTDINYEGTMEQWNSIKFGCEWNNNSDIKRIICADGDIEMS